MKTLPKILDYSKFVTHIRNQDGWGGCGGMSVLHAYDILAEMNEPFTPDLSYAFNSYTYWESTNSEGSTGDIRIAKRGLNQFGVLLEYGCCPESSFHTNYDNYNPPKTYPRPSDSNMKEALGYRITNYTPYPGKSPSTADDLFELKQLLYEHGPLVMVEASDGHVVTLIGYDDGKRSIKYINSVPVATGWGGIKELGYDHFKDRIENHGATVEWMEKNPSHNPETYVARINVSHLTSSRNKITIKIGVVGQQPLVIWDRNCQVNMLDENKDLALDIPLPKYASQFWSPDKHDWYVEISDSSNGAADKKAVSVNEIIFVKRTHNSIYNIIGGKVGIIYAVTDNGTLIWYKHNDPENGTGDGIYERGKVIANGWGSFKHVFGGYDGIIYAVDNEGDLYWYKHLDVYNGSDNWANNGQGVKIGSGWSYKKIFGGNLGIIYAIDSNDNLYWYMHRGFLDSSANWENNGNAALIGKGWNYKKVFGGVNGIIYAIDNTGKLFWYKHLGYIDGSYNWGKTWAAPIGEHWNYRHAIGGFDGIIYGITQGGDPYWYKHLGYIDGSDDWENNRQGNKIRPAHSFFNQCYLLDIFIPVAAYNPINSGQTLFVRNFKPLATVYSNHAPTLL